MKTAIINTFALLVLLVSATQAHAKGKYPLEIFPKSISEECREGIANVYDECSDQAVILENALSKAKTSGKIVLIVYGAEWCIWCHVFDKYIKGESKKFNYKWQYHDGDNMKWKMRETRNSETKNDAVALNKYVSENFVIAHIEGFHSPNGPDVISQTGFDVSNIKGVPFIMVLNNEGRYAGHMPRVETIDNLEIRMDNGKEYRGYNRKILMKELTKLRGFSIEPKLKTQSN